MAAYAYFRSRSQAVISDLEAATTQILALLSTHRAGAGAGREAEKEFV